MDNGKGTVESLVNSLFWKGKKVFLTGHTGFKGSWMSLWLLKAGARLTGYSLGLPTEPSLYGKLSISPDMHSIFGDIRDAAHLTSALKEAAPEIVIHMAAQPLVRYSYEAPVETYMTNVMGTVHLFEAIRTVGTVQTVVNVTSDKCYENQERVAGYREEEPMGGYDPYSSSKGCAELVTSAYRRSFLSAAGIGLASGRAGNVIGGGDWAVNRLVPDIVRSVEKDETLVIRNPSSVRPWQHVLEPVGGYLRLAERLHGDQATYASGYNFGPTKSDHCSVEELLTKMNYFWEGRIRYRIEKSETNPHEAHFLSLDCRKAADQLNWRPRWNLDAALQCTVEWNMGYMNSESVRDLCMTQINHYERAANV